MTIRRMARGAGKVARVMAALTAWSFSRFKDYEKCPAYCKYKHVDKIKEPDTEHTAHGTEVHEAAERYVTGKLGKLPKILAKFSVEFKETKKRKPKVEQEWAFDRDWRPVGWFSPEAWVRVKVDCHYLTVEKKGSSGGGRFACTTVHVIDYKTGKVREAEHSEQRKLYALGAMLMYPDAVAVHVEHHYLDHGEIAEEQYPATQLDELKTYWLNKTKKMLKDKLFRPQPGRYCEWCFYRKENEGPCKF